MRKNGIIYCPSQSYSNYEDNPVLPHVTLHINLIVNIYDLTHSQKVFF